MRTFWTEIYERHFQLYFQKPFDVQVYHGPDGAGLKIATYDWAIRGFHVFASVGLADKLADDVEDDFGEVVLFSDVDDAKIPQLFVNALFFILQHGIPLDSRFAIGFGDMAPEFTQRYDKTSLYFTHPADDDSKFDKVRKGETFGRVYQAFFISPREVEFLEEYGAHVFEQEFWKSFKRTPSKDAAPAELEAVAKKRQQIWSVRRPSCISKNDSGDRTQA
jgi:Suppressor of fused protein (SUFU)